MDVDANYFIRRAGEERRAAEEATSEQARLCHLELAAAYELRVHRLRVDERRSAMKIVNAA